LKAEVWVEDQPLLVTSQLGKGRIIIDGDCSRCYSNPCDWNSVALFQEFIVFLSQ